MLATLLACLVCLAPQEPDAVGAVAVRGDAELSPAAALASAKTKVDDHVRELWRERAERELERRQPFWLPDVLAQTALRRWLADLPVAHLVAVVDREDREREHSFGNSWQTTLWIAEDARAQARSEQRLRHELRALERTTAIKYGGVAAGWTIVLLAVGWLDRLSRGYMTGRLRVAGLLVGAAVPAVAFLV